MLYDQAVNVAILLDCGGSRFQVSVALGVF